jgi:hypothetical protein
MNFHSHPDFTYNPGVLICFKIERDSAMIECKAYNILLSRIRFWKLATTTYREVNAFLFVGAKVFVPVLSAIVAGNLAMAVRGNPIVSNEFMFWASVAILVLSSLDTFLNPREKKSVAFETNIDLCALQEELMIAAEDTETPELFRERLETASKKLQEILDRYRKRGWAIDQTRLPRTVFHGAAPA